MKFKIINIIIILVMLNGVISALSKCMNISLPVSPISLMIVFFTPYVLYLYFLAVQKKYVDNIFNILFFIIFVIMTFKLLYYSMDLNFSSIIFTYLYYVFPLFYFYLGTSLSQIEIDKIIRNIFYVGVFILLIAYMQYIFFESLPSCITDLPFLSSADQNKYIREYLDVIFYRPNGLIANPITLGYFLLILLSITFYYFNKSNEKKYIYFVLFISFMILSLLSRANIVNMIVLFALFTYYRFGSSKMILFSGSIILVLFMVIPILYETSPLFTFIIDRFTGNDSYAAASTQEHLHDFNAAFNNINKYFLFGIPEGLYVGSKQIITDGTWVSLILHFGIFAFFGYFMIWVLLIRSSYLFSKIGDYKGLFFPIFLITIIENIFNSAMLDKGINILIWTLFGLYYRLSTLNNMRSSND